MESVERW